MTPPGQNYPIHEHSFLFWGLYLGVIVTFTVLLLGLFLYMVHRNGQATKQPTKQTAGNADGAPVTAAPEIEPARETTPELTQGPAQVHAA